MRSLLAGWRLSLHRTRADWPIVAAAWLVMLLAAVLLAAGPMYPSAAAQAGLRRALIDAPVADTNIAISIYVATPDVAATDDRVQAELARVIAPLGGSVVRDWRGSATYALPDGPGVSADDQAVVGFLDGLPDHATLVDGSWPAATATGGSAGPIEVVVVDAAAQELGLAVGDTLSLVAHSSDQPVVVPARLAGIFTIDAAADPYWGGDEQLLGGIRDNGQYRTFGPFLTTATDLEQRASSTSVHMQWRIFPDFERLTVDDATRLRGSVESLSVRLLSVTGEDFYLATGLPSILGAAERSLLVSRTGVLLLMAQLAILAAYAIILMASLLVDHRRLETALMRSRGAAARQVAALGLIEGLALAIPAVLVAPWLAAGALEVLNVVGPLADVGLHIAPRVTVDSYLAAGAAGLVSVGLLVLPAVLSARGFAAEQGGLSRQETRTFGQRMGLDVALLAVTGIALWQLRLYGAPLTRTVQGSLGLDPLLVAAPAIGLIAGAVVALRVLPLLAEGAEALVSRGRDLVGSLGSRQLARRPLRYTRSALLLMLAVSMGVFAVSYGATWANSQRDQAAYQTGADVRVLPNRAGEGLPAWALPGAYAGLAGMERASPVERITDGISFPAVAASADLLALDADAATGIVLARGDESATPFGDLMRALREGRPAPSLLALPGGAAYLRIAPRLEFGAITRFNPQTGEVIDEAVDPDTLTGVQVNVSAIVRDGRGLLYRVESGLVPAGAPGAAVVLALEPAKEQEVPGVAELGARLAGPVSLAGLGIDVWLPSDVWATEAVLGVSGVEVGEIAAGPWAAVPVEANGAWSARLALGLQVLRAVPATRTQGTAVEFGPAEDGAVLGGFVSGPAARLAFLPAAAAEFGPAAPVIANRAFLAATASAQGDTITASVEGGTQRLSIVGVVDGFPTTDPARPLLVLDEPTLGLLRLQGASSARDADEWWIAVAAVGADSVAGRLRGGPFASAEIFTVVDRTRGLSTDPVALGIIGALALGFVATGLFAIVGLTVSAAVSARQRRTEFALLRALGLSGRQLASSLWLENGSLVLVSLLAGTGLGLLIGWLVLPFITVTQQAAVPYPPVQVQVPWDRILVLDLASALALSASVIVIGGVLRRLGVGGVLRMGED